MGEHQLERHPCFDGEAHGKFGRLHLPVSPLCNIHCRFCQRSFNRCDRRPGVSAGVEQALALCPQITALEAPVFIDSTLARLAKALRRFPAPRRERACR